MVFKEGKYTLPFGKYCHDSELFVRAIVIV